MAMLTVKVMNRLDWTSEDRLRLKLGSENAASLAASNPSGGTQVLDASPWPNGANRGGFGADPFGTSNFGQTPFGRSSGGFGFGQGEFGYGAFGLNDMPRVVLRHRYFPSNKVAQLPVGVTIADALGNESSVIEQLVQLNDPPVGARDAKLSSTGQTGQVRLSWTASPDVV